MNQFICMIVVFEKTGKVLFELHIEEGTSMNHSQYHLTTFSVDAAIPNLIIIHLENSGIEYADNAGNVFILCIQVREHANFFTPCTLSDDVEIYLKQWGSN